ncbi:MAG: hypothetical protein ACJAQ8_002934 [Haliea salexigens]|jgi:hypothetical protein
MQPKARIACAAPAPVIALVKTDLVLNQGHQQLAGFVGIEHTTDQPESPRFQLVCHVVFLTGICR